MNASYLLVLHCLFCGGAFCQLLLLHTFTVARRRRLRRNRALARALWYKHSKCNLFLSRGKLLWIRQTLASHHSKDRKFIRVISEAMSHYHSEEAYSWRCHGRLNKKTHIHCPVSRKHWSKGGKHETQPTYQWQEEVDDQHWEDWESLRTTRPRSKSPRIKKGKGKGRGNEQEAKMSSSREQQTPSPRVS